MKSSDCQLRKRGTASPEDFEYVKDKSRAELLNLLHEDMAAIRTAAAYQLSDIHVNDYEVVSNLLNQLMAEKCLYTKIAICDALKKGNQDTARLMTEYLGKIGNNQYKTLPERPSNKKSYPLPRDIIARTMGNMQVEIFPVLEEILSGGEISKLSEGLDAIGFMVYYHPELVTFKNAKIIYEVMEQYADNPLIMWKSIVCLSSFPLEQSVKILQRFIGNGDILEEEAKRSLKLIQGIPQV